MLETASRHGMVATPTHALRTFYFFRSAERGSGTFVERASISSVPDEVPGLQVSPYPSGTTGVCIFARNSMFPHHERLRVAASMRHVAPQVAPSS